MADTERPSVTYEAIGVVRSPHERLEGMPLQSVAAKGVRGRIELEPGYEAALKDLDGFSHVWLVSHLHRSEPPAEPVVLPFLDDTERGLFATRSPRHPNPIGLSVVRLLSVEGATLHVDGLDLLDGTPVLDVKPYVPLFDSIEAESTGWLAGRAEAVYSVRSDGRFERPRVCDVMVPDPKTLPHDATVGDVRRLFSSSRIRLALLVRRGRCVGTIGRGDLPAASRDEDSAGRLARTPQTIGADASVADAHRELERTADGRLVVVDGRGRLVGLLCGNHAGDGFCYDRSCKRPAGYRAPTRWAIHRTSGPEEHRRGVLLAPGGKALDVGDTLRLPPDAGTRWLVVDVRDDPTGRAGGIATVDALD